jgi:hypothetical protein
MSNQNPAWPLPNPTLPQANLSTLAHQTASNRIAFLHAAAGYSVPSTWLQAIHKGFYTTWPGLTTTALKRHLRKSIITSLGHLDQLRANRQSTKDPAARTSSTPLSPTPIDDTDFCPTVSLDEPHPEQQTHQIFAACTPITGQIFSDLPGKFVVPSSCGYNYLLVIYDHHDSNAILAEPLKNRTAKFIVTAYQRIHQLLVFRGLRPQLQRLNNEASASLRNFLTTKNVDFQLAPPHLHRRNAAERSIRTFKNHFVAILCGADPNFPIHLWDPLIPQVILTLNLLCGSRINPRLSAHAQLHGASISTELPLARLEPSSSYMRSVPYANPGHPMAYLVGTLAMHPTIIAATTFLPMTPALNVPPTSLNGFPRTSQCQRLPSSTLPKLQPATLSKASKRPPLPLPFVALTPRPWPPSTTSPTSSATSQHSPQTNQRCQNQAPPLHKWHHFQGWRHFQGCPIPCYCRLGTCIFPTHHEPWRTSTPPRPASPNRHP